MQSIKPVQLPSTRLRDWCAKNPIAERSLLYGYKSVLPNIGDFLLSDPRVLKNDHVINEGFERNPIFFLGRQGPFDDARIVLTSIFVFPNFRNQGLGSNLLRRIQTEIGKQAYIQLSIDARKFTELDPFYRRLSFVQIEGEFKDAAGITFLDYVWSARRIRTRRSPDGTVQVMALE